MEAARVHDDSASVAKRYAPLMTTFTVTTAALVHQAARRGNRLGGALQLTEASLATFFLARLVAKEKAGVVVREPFVEPAPGTDPADPRGETKRATGDGLQRTIGELLTCTRCLGPWAATGLTLGQAFAPRHAAIATRILALAGANTLLQAGQACLTETANRQARS